MEGAAYPPQQGYPAQGYPAQGYPVQGYPAQAYPQAYPQQYPATGVAPPPYYPQQFSEKPPVVQGQQGQQQQTSNVVVVGAQPTLTPTVVTVASTGDYYLTLSIVMTILCGFCFSWWALLCTIPAIIVASNARDSAGRGDVTGAKRMGHIALGLNLGAIMSSILIWILVIVIPVSIFASDGYYNYYSYYYSYYDYYDYYYYNYYCYYSSYYSYYYCYK